MKFDCGQNQTVQGPYRKLETEVLQHIVLARLAEYSLLDVRSGNDCENSCHLPLYTLRYACKYVHFGVNHAVVCAFQRLDLRKKYIFPTLYGTNIA